jgi:hypothetical protein
MKTSVQTPIFIWHDFRVYSKNGDIFRDTFKIHGFVRKLGSSMIYDKATAANQDAHCLEILPQLFSQLNWWQNQREIQRRFIRSAGPEIY